MISKLVYHSLGQFSNITTSIPFDLFYVHNIYLKIVERVSMTHIFEFKFQSLNVVCDFIARLKSQMRAQPDKKHNCA